MRRHQGSVVFVNRKYSPDTEGFKEPFLPSWNFEIHIASESKMHRQGEYSPG